MFQAESLTESDSWMCPECQDKEARKPTTGKKRVTTPASSYSKREVDYNNKREVDYNNKRDNNKREVDPSAAFKPIPITPMTVAATTTSSKESLSSAKKGATEKAGKTMSSKKKEEGKEAETKPSVPVPPKKNLVLAEKLKKAATATGRRSRDR